MPKCIAWILLVMPVCAAGAAGQDPGYRESVQEQNVPTWAALNFSEAALRETHRITFELNPFYLRGDFNGDGEVDVALHVREQGTDKRGIAIVHGGGGPVVLLGAGTEFGNGGDDFSWMGIWKVFPADYSPRQYKLSLPEDAAAAEALFVQKPGSAGGVIYWNGQEYVWQQFGD